MPQKKLTFFFILEKLGFWKQILIMLVNHIPEKLYLSEERHFFHILFLLVKVKIKQYIWRATPEKISNFFENKYFFVQHHLVSVDMK